MQSTFSLIKKVIIMIQKNNLFMERFNRAILFRYMLFGAGIALLLIMVFLLPVRNHDTAWGKYWMFRPLIIVPFAGAFGGLVCYFLNNIGYEGWRKVSIVILSLIIYIIILWLGIVLGLDGTLWN